MHKKNSYTYEELLACGRGEMFGEGNAQLPLPPMLMFDRIMSITEDGGAFNKGKIVAELDVHPDLWFFDCHFPGAPVTDARWERAKSNLPGKSFPPASASPTTSTSSGWSCASW